MLVTRIELVKKDLYRIDLDYEFAFALYAREIRQYGLKEGMEISEELKTTLEKEIVLKRARKKAMMLLKYSDRTKEELRKRLIEASFSITMAEEAIAYVESYGYVNDERYIENYVVFKKDSKSRKQIEMELVKKGISKQQVTQYLEENDWDETEILQGLVEKRLAGKKIQDEKEMQKHYGYFMRKGYSYYAVKKAIQEYMDVLEAEENG